MTEYLQEARAFPNGKNDDEIDCTAHAINTFVYINGIAQKARINDFDTFFDAKPKRYETSFVSPDIGEW